MQFQYFINLAERGCFYADVRDESGATVFEIFDNIVELVEDGFMKTARDLDGLLEILMDNEIAKPGDTIVPGIHA